MRWAQEDARRVKQLMVELGGVAQDRAILLLGSEANGLPEEWLACADQCVTIPMDLETDSLNVGVAAGRKV